MSLVLDYVALADAVAADSRGNLSVIGIAPQVWIVDKVPGLAVPSVIAFARDTEDPVPAIALGQVIGFEIKVTGPDGTTAFVVSQQQVIGQKRWPRLPGRLALAAQTAFTAEKTGNYTFTVTLTPQGADPVSKQIDVFVGDPESLAVQSKID